MFKYLLLAALLFITGIVSAQKGTIKGKVIDSVNHAPIEFATVAISVVKDSTSELYSYTLSDKTGAFSLHNLPVGKSLKILISIMAYQPYRKFITLNKGETFDLGTISLSPNQLNEIIINGERPPIVIRKDTIEFNAEAFKTRPNAVVEELLKKLPGMEVSMDGSISFNGKDISKILVNGNDFFKKDYRIATKNLDADMLDKVQVYDDRENDPDHLIPESKVAKIINLKLKGPLKKSVFGKIYAGAGTEDRYSAGGLINMFRDTLQISLLSFSNNLNNTGFSFDDLLRLGGFNRGGIASLSRGGFSPFGGFGSQGIQKVLSNGININTDYGKKLKINLAYSYSRTHTDVNSLTNRQQLVNDTDFTTNTINSRMSVANSHNVSATVRWFPSKATQVTYDPQFSYSNNQQNGASTVNSYSSAIPKIALTANSDNNSGNSLSFGQSFNYNHQFKKQGESIDVSHSFQVSNNDGLGYNINNLTSYTTGLSSFLLNRNDNTISRSTTANVGLSYRYPLSKKLVANVGITGDYSHQVNNTITYDFDNATGSYDLFLQTLSTNLTRNLSTETINPGLTYTFKREMQLVITANTQILQVNNQFDRNLPDINQHFINVLPTVNLNLGSYSLSYQSGFNLPNIGDMIPYTVVSSPLYQVTGNPYLKPTRTENYSINYTNYNLQGQANINAGIRASFEQNSIFRQNTLDAVGATTSTPINMDGKYTYVANVNMGKRFKKVNGFQLRLNTGLNAGKSRGFFQINGQSGFQNAYYFSLNQQMALDWKNIIQLEQSYNLNNTITTYTGVNYPNVNNFVHVLNTHLIATPPGKIVIESTYAYTYRPLVSPGFQKSANLFNLSIAHPLLKKDRGEIKLSCYDLLNESVGSSRFVSANVINDTQSEILRRYLLLTLQFRFNKVIK